MSRQRKVRAPRSQRPIDRLSRIGSAVLRRYIEQKILPLLLINVRAIALAINVPPDQAKVIARVECVIPGLQRSPNYGAQVPLNILLQRHKRQYNAPVSSPPAAGGLRRSCGFMEILSTRKNHLQKPLL